MLNALEWLRQELRRSWGARGTQKKCPSIDKSTFPATCTWPCGTTVASSSSTSNLVMFHPVTLSALSKALSKPVPTCLPHVICRE